MDKAMKNCCLFLVIMFIALLSVNGFAQSIVYVSPAGSDSNNGTIGQPFKTISKGLAVISNGGLVYLRGGTYLLGSSTLILNKNGQPNNYIKIWAYPGEKPILDCTSDTSIGISISGSYYHLKGIEERNAGGFGINILGDNNVIENCALHDNKQAGLIIGRSVAKPSNNLILNCDSYFNYDPPTHGEDADGFGVKKVIGPGNVFRGCRAYNNSDDGWDLWMTIETITIDSCYAFRNGINCWNDTNFQGNGNGFKLGGKFVATPHIVRNCVAFDNAGDSGKGFDENNNPGGQTLFHCTSYRNIGSNYYFKNTVVSGQTHIIKNCISYEGAVSIASGIQENNSWQGFSVSDADFMSLDTSLATLPRNADGSLPVTDLFRLKKSSPLVNAGVNVHLPFFGKAPDIGAFETKE
jgi:hypothetical protein